MIDPIEFEYEGVSVTVHVDWAGWLYEFDYGDAHYFGHHIHSFQAEEGAKEKIRQLKSIEGDKAF